MSNATNSKLRLGPLPRTEMVKLTISVSVELKAMLDQYADLHAKAWSEPVDVFALIPHMLAAFMERDRGFKTLRNGPKVAPGEHSGAVYSSAPTAAESPDST
jgi:hypothetical protein